MERNLRPQVYYAGKSFTIRECMEEATDVCTDTNHTAACTKCKNRGGMGYFLYSVKKGRWYQPENTSDSTEKC